MLRFIGNGSYVRPSCGLGDHVARYRFARLIVTNTSQVSRNQCTFARFAVRVARYNTDTQQRERDKKLPAGEVQTAAGEIAVGCCAKNPEAANVSQSERWILKANSLLSGSK